MPIQVTCPSCSRSFNAPDGAAGKRAKCPKCGSPIDIPAPAPKEEIFDAEADADAIRPFSDEDFEVEPPPQLPATEDQRPCPMCGEMIQRTAVKCRHCNEIFDPLLAKALRGSGTGGETDSQDQTSAILLFVTGILGCFSPILAVYGIVFLSRRPRAFPCKGLAIAGTVLHCVWALILILSVIAGVMAK